MTEPSAGLFALWELPPAAPREAVSFDLGRQRPAQDAPLDYTLDAGGADTAEMSVWRVDLPADPEAARRQLDAQEAQITANQAALETIPARLGVLVNQSQQAARGSLSFAAPPAPPEAELLSLLATVEPQAPASYGLAFAGPGLPSGVDLAGAVAQFQEAIGKIQRLVLHLAWVETRVGGVLSAQTVLGWGGDADTLWPDRARAEQAELHARALGTAVRSRLTLLRSLVILSRGALLVSSLLTSPAGAIMALPAVWRFIQAVLAEAQLHFGPEST